MLTPIFSTQNWNIIISVLTILYALNYFSKSTDSILRGSNSRIFGWILFVFVWLYIGTRPITCYVDTYLYTEVFNLVQRGNWVSISMKPGEWVWNTLEYFCIETTDASGWLTAIAFFYVGGICWATRRWLPRHFTLALILLFSAFSFWSFGTNGIRNGMATSIVLVGLSYITPQCQRNWAKTIPAIVLVYLGCATHNSMYLIAATAILSFFISNTKLAFKVWLICLLMSPFSSNFFVNFGSMFIEDQRLTTYGLAEVDDQVFSRTGWRWDFILYSAMPIILGWYAISKKKVKDWTYSFLLCVYTYANAAWLLINAIAFSNRFAYLSWFMYPILICYPLVKFRLFRNQGQIIGFALIFYLILSLIL